MLFPRCFPMACKAVWRLYITRDNASKRIERECMETSSLRICSKAYAGTFVKWSGVYTKLVPRFVLPFLTAAQNPKRALDYEEAP